jgi:hypothetical protein
VQTSTCHTVPFRTVPFEGGSASSHLPLAGSHHDRRQGNTYHWSVEIQPCAPSTCLPIQYRRTIPHVFLAVSSTPSYLATFECSINMHIIRFSHGYRYVYQSNVYNATPICREPGSTSGSWSRPVNHRYHTLHPSRVGSGHPMPSPTALGPSRRNASSTAVANKSNVYTVRAHDVVIQIIHSNLYTQLPPLFIPDELSRPVHTIHDASYSTTL